MSLGDYCAGSNHVLPTGCTARHASGLSVQSFLKGVHLVEYDADALAEAAPHVLALSAAEDLPAHGAAVAARIDAGAPTRGRVAMSGQRPRFSIVCAVDDADRGLDEFMASIESQTFDPARSR